MKSSRFKYQFKLIFSILLMGLVQIIIGSSYVFSSTLFAQLKNSNSQIKLNSEEISWIASIPTLVCPAGLIIIGILTDTLGRRKSLQLSYIPLILSWLTLAYANSYITLLIGRIILGFSFGSCTCVLYVYLAEICPAQQRPFFSSMMSVFIGVGNISENVMGMFFQWNTICFVLGTASATICISLFLVPESPMWLRARGRIAEAEAAERWFGVDVARDVAGELDAVDAAERSVQPPASRPTTTCAADKNRCRSRWARPTVWKPTLIALGFFACETCSGVMVLMFYTTSVLHDCRVTWDSGAVTVFLFSTRAVSCVVYASLHWVRRKTLATASCSGMAASLLVIVAYMRIFADVERPPFDYVPVAAFAAFVFSAQIGVLPMPWSLCGEIFPMDVKGTMNGVVQTCGYMIMFIVIKIYPMMISILGIQDVWTIFMITCILGALFSRFILPETKGVPLDVILTYFEPQVKKSENNSP